MTSIGEVHGELRQLAGAAPIGALTSAASTTESVHSHIAAALHTATDPRVKAALGALQLAAETERNAAQALEQFAYHCRAYSQQT